MKRLLLVVFLVAGCIPGEDVGDNNGTYHLKYIHDDTHKVGCWTLGSYGGVFCIPDSEYTSGN